MSQEQNLENKNLEYYYKCFSELKVNTTEKRGDAPYKPILLLSVIELIDQGVITENRIEASNELVWTFNKYKKDFGGDKFKGPLSLPFYHLFKEKNKFWFLQFKPEYPDNPDEQRNTNERIRKSLGQLNNYVNYAYLDQELFDLLQDPILRKELAQALMDAWLHSSPQEDFDEIIRVHQNLEQIQAEEFLKKIKNNVPKRVHRDLLVRDASFSKAVTCIYDYRCAFCGLKVTQTLEKKFYTLVDAAHIKPYATFFNDNIQNGISFCKNHHWAFDKGWFCLENDYKIRVSTQIEENFPATKDFENAKLMKDFDGRQIFRPLSDQYLPDPDALSWHRQKRFQA
ncbi:MAG: HNH endonuclease [Microcoleus vaginatus WJT46-NPBG5]|jgi:putative restriction endonuclease|nr:HNH endonuclease [Microcoleus vaginatus WJT46-NPBG5]